MANYPIPDTILESIHRHDDDLLTAGLGLEGLRSSQKPTFADSANPTPKEIRRRAIHASWQASAELHPAGGLGQIYGEVNPVSGREYHAFAHLPGLRCSHRVMLQLPDHFNPKKRCLVVSASPGSRGIYGAIALAGAWGLPRGLAVAYTDKGAGSGYFDATNGSGVRLDGTRGSMEEGPLEFVPPHYSQDSGIGIKFTHSGDHPESHWGDYVLETIVFALAMLERAYPNEAPFTPENTRIIGVGFSNGGAAILHATGRDTEDWFNGVVAVSPNIQAPSSRAFFDYTSEIALYMNSAISAAPLHELAEARYGHEVPSDTHWGDALHLAGFLREDDPQRQSNEALERLLASGWSTPALQTALLTSDVEIWRSAGTAYAGSYLRRPIGKTPCNAGYEALIANADGHLSPANDAVRATWWADATGLPPNLGVVPSSRNQPLVDIVLCLRRLWTGDNESTPSLQKAVQENMATLPHNKQLPLWIVHGEDDGLIPLGFSSEGYVEWLRSQGYQPEFWRVPHVQHFDTALNWPALAARYLPMLPYAYAAMDALWQYLEEGVTLEEQKPKTRSLPSHPRNGSTLTREHLGLKGVTDPD